MLRFLLLVCIFATSIGVHSAELDFDSFMKATIERGDHALEALISDRIIAIDWISYAYERNHAEQVPILLKGRLNLTDAQKSYEVALNMLIHKDFRYLEYIFPLIFPSLSEYQQQSLIKTVFFDKSIPIKTVIFLLSQALQFNYQNLDLKTLFWQAFEDDAKATPVPFFIDMLQDQEYQSFYHDRKKYCTKAFAQKNYSAIVKALCWAAFELDEVTLTFLIDKLINSLDENLSNIVNDKVNQYRMLYSVLYAFDIPRGHIQQMQELCLKLGFTISPGILNNSNRAISSSCLELAQTNFEENYNNTEIVNNFFDTNFDPNFYSLRFIATHKRLKILKILLRQYNFDAAPEFLKQACECHPSIGFGTFILLTSLENVKIIRFSDFIGYQLNNK